MFIFSCENAKITSHYWTGECWIPPKKIPHIQGQRRSPSKMVGEAKLHLESNPIPTRDVPRAQTKPCAHQGTLQRLSQTRLWVSPAEVWVSCGLLQGQGLWVQQTWVWHKPLGGGHHQPQHRAARTYIRLGNKTQFPPQSVGSFHKPLILLHQRAERMKTTITEK